MYSDSEVNKTIERLYAITLIKKELTVKVNKRQR